MLFQDLYIWSLLVTLSILSELQKETPTVAYLFHYIRPFDIITVTNKTHLVTRVTITWITSMPLHYSIIEEMVYTRWSCGRYDLTRLMYVHSHVYTCVPFPQSISGTHFNSPLASWCRYRASIHKSYISLVNIVISGYLTVCHYSGLHTQMVLVSSMWRFIFTLLRTISSPYSL